MIIKPLNLDDKIKEDIKILQEMLVISTLTNDIGEEKRMALKHAITALENLNCGCGICLVHNDMKCPRVILEPGDEGYKEPGPEPEYVVTVYPENPTPLIIDLTKQTE